VPVAVIPTIPLVRVLSDGAAGVARDPTPTQMGTTFGTISRLGGSIAAYPPYGTAFAVSAWGFDAGAAPPGTSTLTVVARGSTFVRGFCYSFGGVASARAILEVRVEEFEQLGSSGRLIDKPDKPDPGIAYPEIGSSPTMPSTFRFTQNLHGPFLSVIDQDTDPIGLQYFESDAELDAPGLFTPITPGNLYRVWIWAAQEVFSLLHGDAVSNIAYDFGPVFFGFT
jgi:hypothetical protein